MIIPCTDCITLAVCKGFLLRRKELYIPNPHLFKVDPSVYNYVSILTLYNKCCLLKEYSLWRESKNGGEFISNKNKVREFYKTLLLQTNTNKENNYGYFNKSTKNSS